MPGSLENSIKYVRIWKFYKVKFWSIEEKILQLKSKLKLANYFELQTHSLFKVNLNCLIRLNSDQRLKRLIIRTKNRTNETTYFTIFNAKILIKQYDKLALFKIKKLKIKILKTHPLNYFDNDVIIIRAVKFIDMIGMQIISDESDLSAKLQSYQNSYSPGYENIPCIVLLNKNIQSNITKNFKIKEMIYFRLWGWRMDDSLNDIKVNQLPVTLILLSSYVSLEYQEEICEAIEGYNVVGFETDLLPTMNTDLVKKILLRILNNNHPGIFMKINKEIEFRNFTNEKRDYLKEVLENNQQIYKLNKWEFDVLSYVEIKE